MICVVSPWSHGRMLPLTTFGGRLHALRLAKGMSQVELARRIGRHPTAIGPYERGEYEPPREVVMRLATLLDSTAEYLYLGRSLAGAGLAAAGVIGAERVLAPRGPAGIRRDLRSADLLAYELQDDAMAPAYRPGQIILCEARALTDPAPLIGKDALVTLRDGRRMLRRLAPGSRRGLVTLAALAAPPLLDIAVASLERVVGCLEPDALGPPRPAGGDNEETSGASR
jgi:transcriptional regulator with XRE-family HTH domain